jgi:CRISP-associated protein Cas1
MTNRILDLSEVPARLHVHLKLLVVERPDHPEVTVPLSDLAVVVASHPCVTYTQAVLSGLAEAGGAFVACNRQSLPVGMFLPLISHHAQAGRFAAQARVSAPVRKRLWKRLVRAKIKAQADTLTGLFGSDFGLLPLVSLVRSGDPANVEARAARRYWPQLFADPNFRRQRSNLDQNILLNYGYAVLRAIVARAICGAGLHPSLGLHHHNHYNAYCLADDLMEPFRPVVDRSVAEYTAEHGKFCGLETTAKRKIIGDLTGRYVFDGEQRTLFDTAARISSSLANVFLGSAKDIELPDGMVRCPEKN